MLHLIDLYVTFFLNKVGLFNSALWYIKINLFFLPFCYCFGYFIIYGSLFHRGVLVVLCLWEVRSPTTWPSRCTNVV